MGSNEHTSFINDFQAVGLERAPGAICVPFLDAAVLPIAPIGDDISYDAALMALKNASLIPYSAREQVAQMMWAAAQESHAENKDLFPTLQDQVDCEARWMGKEIGPTAPTGPEDVMQSVFLSEVHVIRATSASGQTRTMVAFLGDCTWNTEGGVAVLFDKHGSFITAGIA